MSLTSSLLDQGYQKLTRWCSFEFRQMGRDANLDVDKVMKEAVRRLRQRAELLKSVITAFIVHYNACPNQTRCITLLATL